MLRFSYFEHSKRDQRIDRDWKGEPLAHRQTAALAAEYVGARLAQASTGLVFLTRPPHAPVSRYSGAASSYCARIWRAIVAMRLRALAGATTCA